MSWLNVLLTITLPTAYLMIGLFVARAAYVEEHKEGQPPAPFECFFVGLGWPIALIMAGVMCFFEAPVRKLEKEKAEQKKVTDFWMAEWRQADPGSSDQQLALEALKSFGVVPSDTELRAKARERFYDASRVTFESMVDPEWLLRNPNPDQLRDLLNREDEHP